MRAVVKHSYIKGAKVLAKAKAHVKYLEHRPGEDRDQGQRQFFDAGRQGLSGKEVREVIDEQKGRGEIFHKLILSPGCEGVDLQEYTRDTLKEIGKEKGLDLNWKAIAHTNTDHDHIHVLVMGTDRKGRQVRFDRNDYSKLREIQNRYIEREHKLERFLDREMSEVLKDREYRRDGGRDFQRLVCGSDDKERRDRRPLRDLTIERQFELTDKALFRVTGSAGSRGEIHRRLSRQEVIRRQQGRLQEFHADYTGRRGQQYWEEVAQRDPSQAEAARKQIEYIKGVQEEQRRDNGWRDLDSLLGERHSRTPVEERQKIQTRMQVREHIRREHESQQGDQEEKSRDDNESGE